MSDQIFPTLPSDNESLLYLDAMKDFTLKMMSQKADTEEIRAICCYLFVIADAPHKQPFVYFNLHKDLSDECVRLMDFYNHYIYSQGQDYMLETLNREVGPFGEYFNEFQILMRGLNNLAKDNEDYKPFDNLIWGFYCSLYDRRKRQRYLKLAIESLENTKDLH